MDSLVVGSRKIVFGKLRDRLGGRVKGILTGAAACPKKMAQFSQRLYTST